MECLLLFEKAASCMRIRDKGLYDSCLTEVAGGLLLEFLCLLKRPFKNEIE